MGRAPVALQVLSAVDGGRRPTVVDRALPAVGDVHEGRGVGGGLSASDRVSARRARRQSASAVPDDVVRYLVGRAPTIAHNAARACGCIHLADELEGAALEGLGRACRKFDPDRAGVPVSTAQGFCWRSMHFASVDAARNWMGRAGRAKKMAAAVDEIDWEHEGTNEWDDPMAYIDEVLAITETLERLDPMRRAALLCYFDGGNQNDVAKRFGVSTSRIGQLRKQALIRHELGVVSGLDRHWSATSDAG